MIRAIIVCLVSKVGSAELDIILFLLCHVHLTLSRDSETHGLSLKSFATFFALSRQCDKVLQICDPSHGGHMLVPVQLH